MKVYYIVLCVACVVFLNCFRVTCKTLNTTKDSPRVCVIGAGVAGLSSARYLKEEGIDFTVIEATKYVGGTWRYDPRVGVDENGLPLYTSMYKHLRTNLPKPAMELLGFPLPEDVPSFPSWKIFYKYLNDFSKHFDLDKHIKFLHLVKSVRREGSIWEVKYKNIITGEVFEEKYDFVFVCTGHYSKPNQPTMPGEDIFSGTIIHSHDFREIEPYRNRRVLIVGSGPSGMDISLDVASVSKTLVHSTHSVVNFRTPFPPNFIKKPDIKEFKENGVVFTDNSFEEIDDVIYCTGFQYHYPFLDETSGLTIRPRYVIPLYQYTVNIHQPSMVILGLVVRACVVTAIDAQARYATALVKGNFTLPSKDKMMEEWQKRADLLQKRFRPLSEIHLLAENEDKFYGAIANESGTFRVPPVIAKMRTIDTAAKLDNLYTYRNYVYDIIDDNNFVQRYEEPKQYSSCTP